MASIAVYINRQDSLKETSTMSKNLTSAQTTGIIGAILALLALILFVVTRSRRES